jgi:hypothetical protein
MDIIEFYKTLSTTLEHYREKVITYGDAQFKIKELLDKSEESRLDIDVTIDILNDGISDFDDEQSYEESDFDDDQSYEESDFDEK